MSRLLLLLSLFLAGISLPAHAASFDCAQASTPREKLVCSDKRLSADDSTLNQLYQAAMKILPPAAAQGLRLQQRGWLHYLGQACPIPAGVPSGIQPALCLEEVYRSRIGVLGQAAQRKGPFLFSAASVYNVQLMTPAAAKTDDTGTSPGRGLVEISYPRIVSPDADKYADWNKAMAKMARSFVGSDCGPGNGDISVGYSLGLVTSRLISVDWQWSEYCHGTPHGMGGSQVQNFILSPAPHIMLPADLFRTDLPWQADLAALADAEVRQVTLTSYQDGSFASQAGDINFQQAAAVATDPDNWLLTDAGLEIDFGPYVLGLGYPFAPSIVIPWSAMRGFMVADAPVP